MTETVHTETVQTETPHTETPRTETVRPPLRRSRTDLWLGGVSGGLARHTGIDVLLWRAGFAALTLAGGSGVALYLVLWLLMPAAPAGPADRTNVLDEWVERLRARFTGRTTSSAAVPR
ncbi:MULTISPECIES: PspC domain-containing protein [unclassified Modestobacter]|uniref:PspC domain-containing protein n=1 Tax=unclassified Modestobacter TaxID=2643866 RepID=UPI0022AB0964|nr:MULTISPECIES: PspC domain-containing protein [unclassified Modestobacter]MCZ2825288.1 PspC domain-containing protein [Modestobacter sp. VKM Ac-2981]MCZ2853647.1 PspC domain-containing protein [Modestobacter sp. VKM Ac-2982]